jgi:hypothetical protein
MIKAATPSRAATRDAGARFARDLPPGRLPEHHFEIVWANFCDVFDTRQDLLRAVASGQGYSMMRHWAQDRVVFW